MVKNDGGSVFPVKSNIKAYSGMSLRDYIAVQALNGSLASGGYETGIYFSILAERSYGFADAMLKAREKE